MGRMPAPIKLNEYQRDALHNMEREFAEAGRHRWADRCRAVRLRADGYGIDEIARMLRRPYRTAQDWCRLWRMDGLRGMEPKTSTRGRPKKLGSHERLLLSKAIDRSPRAAGYHGSVWTSPMLVDFIRKRWGVEYHQGHVRRLLHQLGFSIQFPKEKLALADKEAQGRWLKRTFPRIKKTPA
jgi:transposase